MRILFIVVSLFIAFQTSALEKEVHNQHKEKNESYLIKEIKVEIEGEGYKTYKDLDTKYLNKHYNPASIAETEKFLSRFFASQDYLIPRVEIVESFLNSDTLYIKVFPKRIINVLMFNDGPDNELIDEYVKKILEAKPQKLQHIAKYMALMNRIPGYQVDNEYRTTKNQDEVLLVLNIVKSRVDFFGSIDSYGGNDLGQMENYLSATVYDKKGGSDAVSFSGFTTNHPDRLYSISAGYITPVNKIGTNLNVGISHSENNSTLTDGIHTTNGNSASLSANFNHLLYMDRTQSLEGNFNNSYTSIVGYTLNDDNGNADDTKSTYLSSGLSLRYSLIDKLNGKNIITTSFSQGIAGVFKNYTDPEDIADKHYNLYQANFIRNQRLPYNFSVYSQFQIGHSNHTLPSSEMYSIGGRDFGRGYAAGTLAGRKIIAASCEVRYNYNFDNNQWLYSAQPYIFRDFGYVGKQDTDTNISHLSSYGAGIRFSVAFDIDIEAEAAKPMKRNYNLYGDPYTSNTAYSALISKSLSF